MRSVRLHRQLLRLLLAFAAPLAHAATEAELRAAVIYNIARFVQWPDTMASSSHFDICTIGDNPLTEALTALEGKPLNNLPVTIRPIRRDSDLSDCRVLYITPHDSVRMAAIAEILADTHGAILTISDAPSFLALGGIVQLSTIDERQRFHINRELAEHCHLNINAKLLQLALPVKD